MINRLQRQLEAEKREKQASTEMVMNGEILGNDSFLSEVEWVDHRPELGQRYLRTELPVQSSCGTEIDNSVEASR